jgi:aminoglycoside/choline kinase family phosphotransferase
MKPEQAEQFLIEELFSQSVEAANLKDGSLEEVDRLTGDASTRRYYRLFTKDNSYVVCLDNPTNETRPDNTFLMVQEFLSKHDVRVPIIYHHNIKRGYLLEEDLGDITLLQSLSQLESTEVELKIYTEVIDEMLKIHNLDSSIVEKTPMSKIEFDYEKLMGEIDFTVKYFIEHFFNVTDRKTLSELSAEFSEVCQRLAKENKVLTHRDFHSRNVMIKDNEKIIIDFQDARMGIPQYDLVSLLEDCYYKVNGENKVKLIKYYYENLPESVHGQKDFSHFMELYCDMLVQRVFKALGSFAYIYKTRKDERYLKYIGFGMEKLRTTFLKHKKYDKIRKKLFKIYYAN